MQEGSSSSVVQRPIEPASKEPSPSTNLNSEENQIMIRNLNLIAERDKPLNQLMKIVALGFASMKEIELFQRYIKRAREMGPPPHDETFWKEYMKNPVRKKKAPKEKIPKEKKPKPPPKEKKPKRKNLQNLKSLQSLQR